MTERIHDDEPDTGERVVRTLLDIECPDWSGRPLTYLRTSGTDNAMWRIHLDDGPDVVARLPRRPAAAANADREIAVLQQIARSPVATVAATPTVRHAGRPADVFPFRWSVLEWIDGTDAWVARRDLDARPLAPLAADLVRVVEAIGRVTEVPVEPRRPGSRGGPLAPLLRRLDHWLTDPQWGADDLIDVPAVQRLARQAEEVVDEPVTRGLVHGDLIPGNLLVERGRLTAVLDWGGTGWGDVAQDLAPAWSVLPGPERQRFRRAVGADDAAWIRGRTFELEHAVGGVLYYRPRNHPLGDVMARTLERVLDDG